MEKTHAFHIPILGKYLESNNQIQQLFSHLKIKLKDEQLLSLHFKGNEEM